MSADERVSAALSEHTGRGREEEGKEAVFEEEQEEEEEYSDAAEQAIDDDEEEEETSSDVLRRFLSLCHSRDDKGYSVDDATNALERAILAAPKQDDGELTLSTNLYSVDDCSKEGVRSRGGGEEEGHAVIEEEEEREENAVVRRARSLLVQKLRERAKFEHDAALLLRKSLLPYIQEADRMLSLCFPNSLLLGEKEVAIECDRDGEGADDKRRNVFDDDVELDDSGTEADAIDELDANVHDDLQMFLRETLPKAITRLLELRFQASIEAHHGALEVLEAFVQLCVHSIGAWDTIELWKALKYCFTSTCFFFRTEPIDIAAVATGAIPTRRSASSSTIASLDGTDRFAFLPLPRAWTRESEQWRTSAVSMVNAFGALGGFDRVIHRLRWHNMYRTSGTAVRLQEHSTVIVERAEKALLDPPIFNAMLTTISATREALRLSFLQNWSPRFRRECFKMLLKADTAYLRTITKEFLESSFTHLNDITLCEVEDNFVKCGELIEVFRLELALKLMQTPMLSKRLLGLGELNELIEMCRAAIRDLVVADEAGTTQVPADFLTLERVADFCTRHRIIEDLVFDLELSSGLDVHEELILRSAKVLRLLVDLDKFDVSQLLEIFSKTESTDAPLQRQARDAIFRLFCNLAKDLKPQLLCSFVGSVHAIYTSPGFEIDEERLKFIERLCLASFQHNASFMRMRESISPLLNILWKSAFANTEVSTSTQRRYLASILSVLGAQPMYEMTERHQMRVTSIIDGFVGLALRNLHEGHSVGITLDFLKELTLSAKAYYELSEEMAGSLLAACAKEIGTFVTSLSFGSSDAHIDLGPRLSFVKYLFEHYCTECSPTGPAVLEAMWQQFVARGLRDPKSDDTLLRLFCLWFEEFFDSLSGDEATQRGNETGVLRLSPQRSLAVLVASRIVPFLHDAIVAGSSHDILCTAECFCAFDAIRTFLERVASVPLAHPIYRQLRDLSWAFALYGADGIEDAINALNSQFFVQVSLMPTEAAVAAIGRQHELAQEYALYIREILSNHVETGSAHLVDSALRCLRTYILSFRCRARTCVLEYLDTVRLLQHLQSNEIARLDEFVARLPSKLIDTTLVRRELALDSIHVELSTDGYSGTNVVQSATSACALRLHCTVSMAGISGERPLQFPIVTSKSQTIVHLRKAVFDHANSLSGKPFDASTHVAELFVNSNRALLDFRPQTSGSPALLRYQVGDFPSLFDGAIVTCAIGPRNAPRPEATPIDSEVVVLLGSLLRASPALRLNDEMNPSDSMHALLFSELSRYSDVTYRRCWEILLSCLPLPSSDGLIAALVEKNSTNKRHIALSREDDAHMLFLLRLTELLLVNSETVEWTLDSLASSSFTATLMHTNALAALAEITFDHLAIYAAATPDFRSTGPVEWTRMEILAVSLRILKLFVVEHLRLDGIGETRPRLFKRAWVPYGLDLSRLRLQWLPNVFDGGEFLKLMQSNLQVHILHLRAFELAEMPTRVRLTISNICDSLLKVFVCIFVELDSPYSDELSKFFHALFLWQGRSVNVAKARIPYYTAVFVRQCMQAVRSAASPTEHGVESALFFVSRCLSTVLLDGDPNELNPVPDEFFMVVKAALSESVWVNCSADLASTETGGLQTGFLRDFMAGLFLQIVQRRVFETFSGESVVDHYLAGMLDLLGSLVKLCASVSLKGDEREHRTSLFLDMLGYVFDLCLFANTHPDVGSLLPVCKSEKTRKFAVVLCLELVRCVGPSPGSGTDLHSEVLLEGVPPRVPDHSDATANAWERFLFERIQYVIDSLLLTPEGARAPNSKLLRRKWRISPSVEMRASNSGFVGLKNLGCICYMNALVQQLAANAQIRCRTLAIDIDAQLQSTRDLLDERRSLQAIAQLEEGENGEEEEEGDTLALPPPDPRAESVAFQFMRELAFLRESARSAFNPRSFCHTNKDWDGSPINVYVQMDVDEYFISLSDHLETATQTDSEAKGKSNVIRDVFGFTLKQTVVCTSGCNHTSERFEDLRALQLQVAGCADITEALDNYVAGDVLDGYRCQPCGEIRSAETRVSLATLPSDTLVIHLKRFNMDFDTMTKFKVNDRFSFPFRDGERLDLQKYCTNPSADDAFAEFVLKGVVVHMGTCDSGHYYSYIRCDDTRWYEFNDQFVRPFELADMGKEAFGGMETVTRYDDKLQKHITETIPKNRSGYLLFYERVHGARERFARFAGLSTLPSELAVEVRRDNALFMREVFVCSKSFVELVRQTLAFGLGESTALQLNARTIKFAFKFFFTVVVRSAECTVPGPNGVHEVKNFCDLLKDCLRRNLDDCCVWFAETVLKSGFEPSSLLGEFWLQSPSKECRVAVAQLLHACVVTLEGDFPHFVDRDLEDRFDRYCTPNKKVPNILVPLRQSTSLRGQPADGDEEVAAQAWFTLPQRLIAHILRSLAYHKWNWRYLDGWCVFWLLYIACPDQCTAPGPAARLQFGLRDCALLQRIANFLADCDCGIGANNGSKMSKFTRTALQKSTDNWGVALRLISRIVRRIPSPASFAAQAVENFETFSEGELVLPPTSLPDIVWTGAVRLAVYDINAIFCTEFLGIAVRRAGGDDIIAMLQHVTWEDASMTRKVSKILLKQWINVDTVIGRGDVLEVIRRLLLDEPTAGDTVQKERVAFLLSRLAAEGAMRLRAVRRITSLVRFFLLLMQASDACRQWGQEHIDKWEWMQNWAHDHSEIDIAPISSSN